MTDAPRGVLTQVILGLHAADMPVKGCRCRARTRGPSVTCPAYREAERYHANRAQYVVDQLMRTGFFAERTKP